MKTEQEHNNEQCTMNNVQWKKVKLGECCTIHGRIGFRGYTTDDLVEKGYGAITFSPSDIHNFKLCYDDCDYITWKKYEESPEIKVFNGDILFCKTASIGKCAYVEGLKEKATINPQFVVLKNFQCDSKFLFYKLISYGFQTQVQGITGGSTIKTMSQEKLSLEEISVPNLPAQRRIAAILASADKVIVATQKTIAKYKQIKQGMMEDLLKPKDGWKKVKLGEVCAVNPKTDTTKVLDDDFVTFVRMEDVSNDGIIASFSERPYKSLLKKGFTIFQNDDVIFAKITPCMENGKGALVRNMKSKICMGSTEFHVLRACDNVSIDFIYQLTISKQFRQRAEMQMTGSAGQQRVPTAFLEDYLISIPFKNGKPDLTAQRRIAAILSGIDAKIAAEEKVLQKYEKVKKGLMERLFSSN